jgi:hypothetical protein
MNVARAPAMRPPATDPTAIPDIEPGDRPGSGVAGFDAGIDVEVSEGTPGVARPDAVMFRVGVTGNGDDVVVAFP